MKRGGSLSGAVSLVMIFCVLCLAVFATLTLATAQREKTLSDLTARRAADYYEADAKAMELAAAVKSGKQPEGVEFIEPDGFADLIANYTVPINEEQALEIQMQQNGGEWRVNRWQTVYVGDWETEDSLLLWDFD